MKSAKLSYPGIAGAVAGIIGLIGVYTRWFSLPVPGGSVTVNGTADISGKLALAMSLALFAFSAAYVLIDDARIRRSMAALIIATSVVLTLAVVWGITRADGLSIELGLWVSGLGGVLGIGAGVLTLKDSPVDADVAEGEEPEAEVPASAAS